MQPEFYQPPQIPVRRRGITLLEVMISIGVVGIGLLGVAALLPLAHHKAAQGVREDRKALMGKRAFREFRVRDFDRPGLDPPANPATRGPFWVWNRPAADPYASIRGIDGRLVRRAYCLDPLMSASIGSFRLPENGLIWVPRITLLSSRPEDLRRNMTPLELNQLLNNAPPLMTQAQAEEIFRLQDELVFDQPDDESQPAFQVYVNQTDKRASAGSFSWMATIVPELSPTSDPLSPMFNPLSPTSDRYTVSIVVFHRRELTRTPLQEVVAEVDPNFLEELTAPVKQIRVFESGAPEIVDPPHAGVRHIKNGEWILLMQQRIRNVPLSVTMKWYRVMAADELDEVPTGQVDLDRILALEGPDWPQHFETLTQPLYAVYLRNVVAVYEKTIRLHDSSIYAF